MSSYISISETDSQWLLGVGDACLIYVHPNSSVGSEFFAKLADFKPGFIAFAGQSAESIHDEFDGYVFDADDAPMTIWQGDDEGIDEFLSEFLDVHVPLNHRSQNYKIIEIGGRLTEIDLEKAAVNPAY